jgi:membrane-bound inhibitor of C-type lysozyme
VKHLPLLLPLVLLPLAALAACGPTETTVEKASSDLARGADARRIPLEDLPVNPAVTATKSVAWECDGGMPVTAIYGTGADGMPDVTLVIQGYDITLKTGVSASGARYVADIGLEAGKGLVWWEKGEEASLADFPEGTNSLETATVKRTCRVKK